MDNREEKDMSAVVENSDLKKTIIEAIEEVNEIRAGDKHKVDWRQALAEIEKELEAEK